MNHRALIGQYVALQNPHLRQRPRFPFLYGVAIAVVIAGGFAAVLWFVCNIVVVGPL